MFINVTESVLASVLFFGREYEEYPEPYRRRSDLTLVVSFDEYVKFIKHYLDVNNYLATDTVILQLKLANEDTDFLIKAFYKDMSLAILKELWFDTTATRPTRIVHSIADVQDFDNTLVNAYLQGAPAGIKQARKDLLAFANTKGYEFNQQLINNLDLWNYATVLFAMASPTNRYGVGFIRWSMRWS